jgi:hypothetical protein
LSIGQFPAGDRLKAQNQRFEVTGLRFEETAGTTIVNRQSSIVNSPKKTAASLAKERRRSCLP